VPLFRLKATLRQLDYDHYPIEKILKCKKTYVSQQYPHGTIDTMNKTLREQGYHSSETTVYRCMYHVIFCPKYRRKVLTPPIQERLKEIVEMVAGENNSGVHQMEIMEDHVHLLLDADPAVGISVIVSRIKGRSSNILRREFPELKRKLPTLWTRSKFISTVGTVSLDIVKKYIEDQKGK
jgi:putative transposase